MTGIQLVLLITASIISIFITISILINFTRNFFTRFRYVRVETFNQDKSVTVSYYKKSTFNIDHKRKVNTDHIFNMKGYTTLIFTDETAENINPLDFESNYPKEIYETAISNNDIAVAFSSLKSSKLDMLKIAVIISGLTLLLVAYLIIKQMGLM